MRNFFRSMWMNLGVARELLSFLWERKLWWLIPMDNPGRVMLVCAAIGSTVFGAMIEWPVLQRSQRSADPLAELSKIDNKVLVRSAFGSASSIALTWLVAV